MSPRELVLLQNVCHDNAVLFDVGANVGYFTTLMGRLNHGSRIFSFEPSPTTCEILRRNIELNGLSNVQVEALAFSDADGCCQFSDDARSSATNHLVVNSPGEESSQNVTWVQTMSLDSFTMKMNIDVIDFLKIDVEGAEVLLIRGAKRLLRERRVRVALIELCPGNLRRMNFTLEDLFQEVESTGYTVRELGENGRPGRRYTPREIPPDALLNGILIFQDADTAECKLATPYPSG
jgi:FkbM family methyltransferase